MTEGPVLDVVPPALALLEETVASVRDADWDRPSNLARWTVRDVVGHVTGSVHKIAAFIDDDPVGAGRSEPADSTGGDPVAQLRAQVERAVAALPLARLDELRKSPMGEVPLGVALRFPTVDAIVHSWDIQHSLGRLLELPEPLLAFARQLTDMVQGAPGGPPPTFDPPVPPADGDTPTQALMKRLGRPTD